VAIEREKRMKRPSAGPVRAMFMPRKVCRVVSG
jgi:hypothetical protein